MSRDACFAKINLCLHVGPRRADGFHPLGSVVVPVPWADELEVEAAPGSGRVDLALAPGGDPVPADGTNLAVRAARAFLDATGNRHDVAIRLAKRVPVGAGLGGGSADAAHVLRRLDALLGQPLSPAALHALAAGLGSDCPYFLDPAPAWMSGRGEALRPLPGFPRLSLAIAVPPERLSTAAVFRAFDERQALTPTAEGDIHPCLLARGGRGTDGGLPPRCLENDLAPVAFDLCPRSRELRDALLERGASAAGVTGAGSAVFGVFATPGRAAQAAAALAGAMRGVVAAAFETVA
ncbi:MAG TPA: 4-(cytidine 5'-diphospho)-2-C-methyl-D-erythritol kinase [Myxococcota bacterium]|nr:4-(cytidine 5'-diphospho)-2-C-methyl-D-erythritol kinase [Myxococcota bacterium]